MLMLVTFLPQLHLTLDDLFYISVNFGLCVIVGIVYFIII